MQIFFIQPVDVIDLQFWYIFEAVLLVANGFLFFGFIVLTIRVRLHINLKILGLFMILQYYPCCLGRAVTIAYESGLLVLEGNPEQNVFIVVSSWIRCYYFSLAGTVIFWFSIERQTAMYYIEDYERLPRKWIPITLMICASISASLSSTVYHSGSHLWFGMALVGGTLNLFGFYLYYNSYQSTKRIVKMLTKHASSSRHRYTLSLRFQLEENLWCAQILKNAFITLAIIGGLTGVTVVVANLDVLSEYLGEAKSQLLKCISNTIIAADGPIIGLGAVAYNDHLKKIVGSMFCRTVVAVEPEQDPGQVYFIQLRQQWNTPLIEQLQIKKSNNYDCLWQSNRGSERLRSSKFTAIEKT